MKAARLHAPRDVRVEDIPAPEPGPGMALVRTRAVGLCGSDLHYYREGRIGDSLAAQPLVLGHEFSADVVALGPGLDRDSETPLRPGMAVAVDPAIPCGACEHCLAGPPNVCPRVRFAGTPPTDGALQEYLAWPAHLLHPLPAGMSADVGALLEPLGVAIHALDLARVRLADTVAVLGAGPIGLLAIRLANLSGAVRVFATDVLPERVAAARAFGAHDAILTSSAAGASSRGALAADPVAWVRERTGGRGVDVVIECAGADETPRQAVEMARPGGTVVLVGIPSDDRVEFGAAQARRKGLTIKLCRRMRHVYPRAIALVQAGLVDLPRLVSHRFRLEDAPRAFQVLDQGDGGVLKAVIEC
jgi:L-iditol 2-dehydrogenase